MPEVTCPSGAKLRIRGMKGKELRLFQDKKGARDGATLDRILDACVEEVLDPGPYKLDENARLSWNDVLLGDEFFVFVEIRRATFGDEYSFKVKCPDCGYRFEWMINLGDLPIKKLSDAAAGAMRAGRLLETSLTDGRRVCFRLSTGKDEREVLKLKTSENPMVSMLANVIESIGDERDKTKIRRELEEAPLGDLMTIRKLFDKSDCGVETTIEIKCPVGAAEPGGIEEKGCGEVTEMSLPLGRGFLLAV